MCGIVGYVGGRDAVPILLEGLHRLQYRGYDSAGIVVVSEDRLETVRAAGKLERLREKLTQNPLAGHCGLGHTRWATHGPPTDRNAHPIADATGRLALIHNGIIENFADLKARLLSEGWKFTSETDTEVIANLISSYLNGDLTQAVARASQDLEGHFAFAVVSTVGAEREIIGLRNGPPLVLGSGQGEQFLASDPTALLMHTRDVLFLENGDMARLQAQGIEVLDAHGKNLARTVVHLDWDPIQAEKGGFKHFMLKEIHEQPRAIQETFGTRAAFEAGEVDLSELGLDGEILAHKKRVQLLACGTSWHAALVGKFLIEEIARVPVEVDYGSEYRYRNPLAGEDLLAVGISQSGETADTLAAMEEAESRGARLLTICNVPGSQATRISSGIVLTHAGPEIGVASTKAFTTQLMALYLLAVALRQARGLPREPRLVTDLARVPQAVSETLALQDQLEELAKKYARCTDFLYLGRGINYPIALEGALKLKEISYIHAEGYPAGEMKHGPIALIDEDLPVVAMATGNLVYEKVWSNLQEVKARDGLNIVITDRDGSPLESVADEVIRVPRVAELVQPIVNVIPLQLFAYFMGLRRGADVDQPRNLAKSVTVE